MKYALIAALLSACVIEHALPRVTGDVSADPSASTTSFDTVVVRMSTPDFGEWDRQELAKPSAWPIAFDLGGSLGNPKTKHIILDAWLATGPDSQAPAAGAPHFTHDLADCIDAGCVDLAVTLAP